MGFFDALLGGVAGGVTSYGNALAEDEKEKDKRATLLATMAIRQAAAKQAAAKDSRESFEAGWRTTPPPNGQLINGMMNAAGSQGPLMGMTGINVADLIRQQNPTQFATDRFQTNPTTGESLDTYNTKSARENRDHMETAVEQAGRIAPIEVKKAADTAQAEAPIKVQTAIAEAKGTAPTKMQLADHTSANARANAFAESDHNTANALKKAAGSVPLQMVGNSAPALEDAANFFEKNGTPSAFAGYANTPVLGRLVPDSDKEFATHSNAVLNAAALAEKLRPGMGKSPAILSATFIPSSTDTPQSKASKIANLRRLAQQAREIGAKANVMNTTTVPVADGNPYPQ